MKRIIVLILSIIMISCGDISLETTPIVVTAIEDGEILLVGDVFDISFNKSSDSVIVNPTSAEIKFEFSNLNILQTEEVLDEDNIETVAAETESKTESDEEISDRSLDDEESDDLDFIIDLKENPNPQFKISNEFKEGIYTLYISVFENDELITEYESDFMVYSGLLRGSIKTLFPSEYLYTDSKIILESAIEYESSIDPYLVWRNGDELITHGYLSDNLNKIIWDTANNSGFINITLDLFPFKLDDPYIKGDNSLDFPFTVNPLGNNLYDESKLDLYYKALFFNGNYIDEKDKYIDIVAYGSMLPGDFDNYFGMIFDGSRGFHSNDSIFPFSSESEESPLSFSLIFDFLPTTINNGSILVADDGNLNLRVYVKDGALMHSYVDDSGIIENAISVIEAFKNVYLVITYVKTDSGYSILYYIDGVLVGKSSMELSKYKFSSDDIKTTTFGSSSDILGFTSIMDTFSIYYMDSSGSNNIYPNHLLDRVDPSYQYRVLDGFNSLVVPYNLYGDGEVDGEILLMAADSSLDYSDVFDPDEDFEIEIEASDDSNYILTLKDESGEFTSLSLEGSSEIKGVSDSLFLNGERLSETLLNYIGFNITAIDNSNIDSITVVTWDRLVVSK